MNIEVSKENVVILNKTESPHENEYNITECNFTFDEFTDSFQVKRAIFTILSTGEMYEIDIINGKCFTPSEVLKHEYETIKLGVYGYNIEIVDEKEVLKERFSPSYDTFVVPTGSYEEGALSPEIITPSQYDIYSQALQEGLDAVADALEEVSHVDIDASKSEGVSTVTITNRHNQEKTVEILDGEDGYTPVKGVDYFTTAEIEEIESETKEQVKTDLDFDNIVNRINQDILDLNTNKASKTELENEKTARELADTNLQGQIDAITSSKDVVDIVGTYSDLQNYDTSTLTEEDVIKVLDDSTHNNAMSYYRWSNGVWNYIGSEGPFYTKSETDSLLNTKQATIDSSHKLASDLVDDTNQTHKFTNENEKNTWNAKYDKPANGIPKSDLVESVQESLNKADSAIQDVSDKEDKSNKVTEINSSSTDTQYPSAKCVYDSQTAQDTEIDILKMIYNILPTDTDTGETISIDNTGEMPIKSIQLGGNTTQEVIPAETGTNVNATSISINDVDTSKEHTIGIDGNTYQETTTGKNLCPNNLEDGTINGVTFVVNDDGSIKVTGTASARTEPYLYRNTVNPLLFKAGSYKNTSNYPIIMYADGYILMDTNSIVTLTEDKLVAYIYFRIEYTGTSLNETYYPQIISSSITDETYEPYTNGPSPNPSYPQNIEVVTGENDITIEGKNLFNKDDVENNKRLDASGQPITNNATGFSLTGHIKVKPNTQYTYSRNITSAEYYVNICEYTKDKTHIERLYKAGDTTTTYTFTTPNNCEYLRINDATTNLNSIQLEQGSTASTYEPYVSQTYPVNLGNIELCKIGTYKDRIYKSNDKWYLEKNIGKVVLNSSEEWKNESAANNDTTMLFYTTAIVNTAKSMVATDSDLYKSDLFITYNCYAPSNKKEGSCYHQDKHLQIRILKSRLSDENTDGFKTWLSSNNVTSYYQLNTPITTEITSSNYPTLYSQLNALYNSTLYSTTNINTETSNLLPYIDLTYNVVTPSPSPNRPSVVNVVKGENTLTICGKNLWDGINKLVTVNENGDKRYGFVLSAPGKKVSVSASTWTQGLNYKFLTNGVYGSGYGMSSNTTLNVSDKVIFYESNPYQGLTIVNNLQIEISDTPTTYKPYKSQTYPINLPSGMELCKISTYQDYFYKDNGNWYKHSEIGKVMVNGSEDWNRTSIGGYSRFELDGVDYLKGTAATTTPNFISNYLIAKNFTEVANGSVGVSWWWNISRKLLIIGLGDDRTLSDFKTWLSTHNTTVYYPLSTPTNTQITDTTLITQLDNLQKAISYDSQTNISQTNEDKPFIITAEMFLSLKNVLN